MKTRYRLAATTAMESILGPTFPAWTEEWIQGEGGQWVHEENEEPLKNWNRINGAWYCLDTEVGVQIERPSITAKAACRLLENKLVEMEIHQDEGESLQFKVGYENNKMVQVLAGYKERSDMFHRISTYEIDKKRGIVGPMVGEKEFPLW